MGALESNLALNHFSEEISRRKAVVAEELRSRAAWFVRLRWWAPPVLIFGSAVGWLAGIEISKNVVPVALYILLCNSILWLAGKKLFDAGRPQSNISAIQRYTHAQVILDFTAIFLLIHATGGAASPFIFFFIFHIIFASILLRPIAAYAFAAIAAVGMPLLAAAEYSGLLQHQYLVINHSRIDLADHPAHMAVELFFFGVSVFVAAFCVSSITRKLNQRIMDLSDLTESVGEMNRKFESLFAMTQAILSTKELDSSLDVVAGRIAEAGAMEGVSILLLENSGRELRCAAERGMTVPALGKKFSVSSTGDAAQRAIDKGKSAYGDVGDGYPLDKEALASGFDKVALAPISAAGRCAGILCSYGSNKSSSDDSDMYFLRLAADIIGIAVENSRSFHEAAALAEERAWFMTQVAHNMRAPLAAVRSILDIMLEGYDGELNSDQSAHLERVSFRLEMMGKMVDELLTLARSRTGRQKPNFEKVDISAVAKRSFELFARRAAEDKIDLTLDIAEGTPPVKADEKMLEQIFENLISNAVKYTRPGGSARVAVGMDGMGNATILVADTGIGVPEQDRTNLFSDFFRAGNAKELHGTGSGLGLSITRKFVEMHDGTITFFSRENQGTTFEVSIPLARNDDDELKKSN